MPGSIMTPERWNRIQELFEAALEKPAPDRPAFLDDACGEDAELRQEVAALLQADGTDSGMLDGHALDTLDLMPTDDIVGQHIGPYQMLERIGEGGMGVVYRAERADGQFEQQVALKLIKLGMDSEQIRRRFQAERQILARLQHDNIARLYDGGITEDGRPYFAMEFVEGRPIDQYCDDHRLSIDHRLDLFVTTCKAVLYAHANLIVHRDLKPENILVTPDGKVKLLDFGIAKMLGGDEDATAITSAGGRVLTPGYASPEQLRGDPIGTSTDIYSLGVVLYELLAGQRPFGDDDGQTEPNRPSTALRKTTSEADTETISRARGTYPQKLRRRLSGDLDVICLKALRHEPERRYASVEALSEDIRRHQTGRPVSARPEKIGYLVRKFVGRHRVGVAMTTAAVLLIVTLVSFYTNQLAEERDRAQDEATKAQEIADFLENIFVAQGPTVARGETVTALDLLDAGADRINDELADQPVVRANLLRTLGNVYRELGFYKEAEPALEQAYQLHLDAHGTAHLETARSQIALAILLDENDEPVRAEALHREALATMRSLLPPNDPVLIEGLSSFSAFLRVIGEYPEAEALLREELQIARLNYEADNPIVTDAMTRLARQLRSDERFDEAEPLFREALEAQRQYWGGPHPDIASTSRNLASLLRDLEKYEESEALYLETLAMRRKLYGDTHIEVAIALGSYAQMLRYRGDMEKAAEISRENITVAKAVFGDVHKEVATALYNLGLILRDGGDLPGSVAAFEETLAIEQAVLQPDNPTIGHTFLALAEVIRMQGNHPRAEALIREGHALWSRSLAPNHRYFIDANSDLGLGLIEQGRLEDAEAALMEAYNLGESTRGVEDYRTQGVVRRLVYLYEEWGRVEKAEEFRDKLVGSG